MSQSPAQDVTPFPKPTRPSKSSNRTKRTKAVQQAKDRQKNRCAGLDLIPGHECRGELVGHEPLKRSAGGDACDPNEILAVCAWLNQDIEDRPWLYEDTPLWISGGVLYVDGRYLKRRERQTQVIHAVRQGTHAFRATSLETGESAIVLTTPERET